MKQTSDISNSATNIISFKKYKDKKTDEISSTIAAIIAIKIDHPSEITPEEFFVNQLDNIENIDVLAFEDALDNSSIGLTTKEAQNDASNDAWSIFHYARYLLKEIIFVAELLISDVRFINHAP